MYFSGQLKHNSRALCIRIVPQNDQNAKKAKDSDFFKNLKSLKRAENLACPSPYFWPPAQEISGQANQPSYTFYINSQEV